MVRLLPIFLVALLSRDVKWGGTRIVLCVHIRAFREKKARQLLVPKSARPVERRAARVKAEVPHVHIRAICKKQLSQVFLTCDHRAEECRSTVVG